MAFKVLKQHFDEVTCIKTTGHVIELTCIKTTGHKTQK
jgi:hypothetical protein